MSAPARIHPHGALPSPRAPVDRGEFLGPLSARLVELAAIDAFTLARRNGRPFAEAMAAFDAAENNARGQVLRRAGEAAPLVPEIAP